MAKKEQDKYHMSIDDYTISRYLEDTSLLSNKSMLIEKLTQLKSDSLLRYTFYGNLNYYYENYRNLLKQNLTLYKIQNYKRLVLSNDEILNITLDKIYESKHREIRPKYTNTQAVNQKDSLASFPGGEYELMRFIKDHITYPEYEKELDISGRVLIRFVVEKDGTLSDFDILKSVSPGLDCEAIKLAKMLPTWIPAKIDGKPVRVYYAIPIYFKLQ